MAPNDTRGAEPRHDERADRGVTDPATDLWPDSVMRNGEMPSWYLPPLDWKAIYERNKRYVADTDVQAR